MKQFDKMSWRELMARVVEFKTSTFEDNQPDGIVLRHDVDDNIDAAVAMACEEHKLGIRSTYFILDTSPYWNSGVDDHIKAIRGYGHNIGWHNNYITRAYIEGEAKALSETHKVLDVLRSSGPCTGTASHGDQMCYERHYLNYHLWADNESMMKWLPVTHPFNRYVLIQFGFDYEAYFTGYNLYLSDAGGVWSISPDNILRTFKQEGGKMVILIHPQWWKL